MIVSLAVTVGMVGLELEAPNDRGFQIPGFCITPVTGSDLKSLLTSKEKVPIESVVIQLIW